MHQCPGTAQNDYGWGTVFADIDLDRDLDLFAVAGMGVPYKNHFYENLWPEMTHDGVTVELLDGTGSVIASQVTAGDGGYLFVDLAPGSDLVRVDASTLPVGFGPTFDFDGIDTPHRVGIELVAFEDERRVDFGYRYGIVAPPPPSLVCFDDGVSGDILGSLWQSADLGDADQGSSTIARGSLEVTADGTSLYQQTFTYAGSTLEPEEWTGGIVLREIDLALTHLSARIVDEVFGLHLRDDHAPSPRETRASAPP